jgi:aryl-alcohol dehydrogenase-like predicted oxidoreductase
VTAPIIGPRTRRHLDAAIRALDVALDAESLDGLDKIYAW